MKYKKYHTVGTVKKNHTVGTIEKSHKENPYTKHTYIWPLDFPAWSRDSNNMWRLKASFI